MQKTIMRLAGTVVAARRSPRITTFLLFFGYQFVTFDNNLSRQFKIKPSLPMAFRE